MEETTMRIMRDNLMDAIGASIIPPLIAVDDRLPDPAVRLYIYLDWISRNSGQQTREEIAKAIAGTRRRPPSVETVSRWLARLVAVRLCDRRRDQFGGTAVTVLLDPRRYYIPLLLKSPEAGLAHRIVAQVMEQGRFLSPHALALIGLGIPEDEAKRLSALGGPIDEWIDFLEHTSPANASWAAPILARALPANIRPPTLPETVSPEQAEMVCEFALLFDGRVSPSAIGRLLNARVPPTAMVRAIRESGREIASDGIRPALAVDKLKKVASLSDLRPTPPDGNNANLVAAVARLFAETYGYEPGERIKKVITTEVAKHPDLSVWKDAFLKAVVASNRAGPANFNYVLTVVHNSDGAGQTNTPTRSGRRRTDGRARRPKPVTSVHRIDR